MKFETNVITLKPEVEVGDMVICEHGSYLVAEHIGRDFPYKFIDINTLEVDNAYISLKNITIGHPVSSRSGKIQRVVKSKNLKLVEVQ